MNLSFTVYGRPQPQGSAKSFIPKGWNRAVITTDNKTLKPWRQDVSDTACIQMRDGAPSNEAIIVRVNFYFERPRSTSKKILSKITKPDVDKLARGILDSLTGIAFRDDAQVIALETYKHFGLPERAEIEVCELSIREDFSIPAEGASQEGLFSQTV